MAGERQHMVQRAYLESWASKKSQLRVWDKYDGSVRLRGLNQATVVDRHNHPDHIEQGFWAAEREIKVILRWAAASSVDSLRVADAAALSRWINMALMRHRYAGFAGQAQINAVLLMTDGTTRQGTGSEGIAIQKMLADAEADGVTTMAGTAIEVQPPVIDLSMWAHIAVVPVRDSSLITGDAMVDLFPGADGRQAGPAGLLLPLSPSRLLVGMRYGSEFHFGDLAPDSMDVIDPKDPTFLEWVRRLADLSNVHVAGASQRFVVSRSDSKVLGESAMPPRR